MALAFFERVLFLAVLFCDNDRKKKKKKKKKIKKEKKVCGVIFIRNPKTKKILLELGWLSIA